MSKETSNQEIIFAKHPDGIPTKETFEFNGIEMPELKEDQVLLKTLYVSVDPGMRGFMDKGEDDAAGKKYEIGKPITSRSVAQILESNS